MNEEFEEARVVISLEFSVLSKAEADVLLMQFIDEIRQSANRSGIKYLSVGKMYARRFEGER